MVLALVGQAYNVQAYENYPMEVCVLSINVFLTYIILGITLAAPIGPVNSLRLDKGLKNGFWHAWIVGVGSMLADAIFMLLVYLGLVNFIEYEPVQVFLWLFGGFILVYSGIECIINSNKISLDSSRNQDSLTKCFFSGFIMSISSPLSILFWLGIYGSVLAKTSTTATPIELLVYSSMIFLGLGIWDVFIASLTTAFRKYLNLRMIIIISLLSGLSLIGFGAYFLFQGVHTLFLS